MFGEDLPIGLEIVEGLRGQVPSGAIALVARVAFRPRGRLHRIGALIGRISSAGAHNQREPILNRAEGPPRGALTALAGRGKGSRPPAGFTAVGAES